MTTTYVDVDVRPILRAGGEPFEQIMEAVNVLKPGEGLRLFATFKPTPLLHVLGSKGFTHVAKELDGGEWEVVFSPSGTPPTNEASVGTTAHNDTLWPEPIKNLDNRELDPPEPMVQDSRDCRNPCNPARCWRPCCAASRCSYSPNWQSADTAGAAASRQTAKPTRCWCGSAPRRGAPHDRGNH